MMKRLILIAITVIAAAGCNRFDIDELLLQREDVSLTVKGTEEFSYNPDTCQLGYNDESNEFRVFDDNAGHWFKIRCSASPDTEGQIIKATLNYTTKDDNKSLRDIEMTVRKISDDGRVWLWSDSRKIGIVVKRL